MIDYILIGIVILVSALVQGFSGFAFSLVLVPLLGLFFPFKDVVVLNLIFSFVLNASVFINLRKHARVKETLTLIIFACIFTIIGANVLKGFDEKVLKIVLGLLLTLTSVLNILKINIDFKNPKRYYPIVGSISGFLNGLSGISGPPLIIFFSNTKMDKLTYKATFNTFFLSLNIVALITYSRIGVLTFDLIKVGGVYAIFVVIGAYTGLFLSYKASEVVFKQIVVVIVMLMGILMIVGEL